MGNFVWSFFFLYVDIFLFFYLQLSWLLFNSELSRGVCRPAPVVCRGLGRSFEVEQRLPTRTMKFGFSLGMKLFFGPA